MPEKNLVNTRKKFAPALTRLILNVFLQLILIRKKKPFKRIPRGRSQVFVCSAVKADKGNDNPIPKADKCARLCGCSCPLCCSVIAVELKEAKLGL